MGRDGGDAGGAVGVARGDGGVTGRLGLLRRRGSHRRRLRRDWGRRLGLFHGIGLGRLLNGALLLLLLRLLLANVWLPRQIKGSLRSRYFVGSLGTYAVGD